MIFFTWYKNEISTFLFQLVLFRLVLGMRGYQAVTCKKENRIFVFTRYSFLAYEHRHTFIVTKRLSVVGSSAESIFLVETAAAWVTGKPDVIALGLEEAGFENKLAAFFVWNKDSCFMCC